MLRQQSLPCAHGAALDKIRAASPPATFPLPTFLMQKEKSVGRLSVKSAVCPDCAVLLYLGPGGRGLGSAWPCGIEDMKRGCGE